jgi:uncharacterized membrane protein YedE/YeeE
MAFTPVSSLLGGALIGLSASFMLVLNGRVAGISGILGGALKPAPGDVAWRMWFLGGLLLGAITLAVARPEAVAGAATGVPVPLVVVAGLLVGVGTQLGSGCTSGHGVCGISRGSPRSLVATLTFMVTGAVAAFVVQHVLLGAS